MSAEDEYLASLPSLDLTEVLAQLPALESEVLMLTANGLSQVAIAQKLGISQASVSRHLQRARAIAKELL